MSTISSINGVSVCIACCCIFACTQSANGAAVGVTYDAVAEKLLANSSIWPGGDAFDQEYELLNNTGQAWTDFHFRLALSSGPPGTFGFIDDAIGGHDGTAYEG